MTWKSIIKNPKTSIGALMCLTGVVLVVLKNEYGIPLIGLAGTWIGLMAKDEST